MTQERSLDPEDWTGMRALGHRMLDDTFDHLATLGERPVWQPPTAAARAAFARGMPQEGEGAAAVYEEFRRHVLPHAIGNAHPRFWGWVCGSGTAMGMLADLLASGANIHAAFGDQSGTHVERQVIDWFTTLLGMPAGAGGLLVSSCSAANLTALAAARDAIAPTWLDDGPAALDGAPCIVYASAEVHNSVDKAVGLLGLGRRNLRRVPVDADYRIVPAALEDAIAADRAAGRRPACVVANAGTVNTGAIDDLEALGAIARREGLWYHVDGAFGAALAMSPRLRPLLRGIERADSIAFDFHKWFHVPYDVGCVLVRDAARLPRTFAPPATYLASLDRGVMGGGVAYSGLGPDGSRRFRALKVWMSLKELGAARYAEQVEQNVAQAGYLASLVERSPVLELAAPAPLNVVCFRHRRPGRTGDEMDALNREILFRVQERGIAVPSSTVLGGRFALRCAITNHRSTRGDFALLVAAVEGIGRKLTEEEGEGEGDAAAA